MARTISVAIGLLKKHLKNIKKETFFKTDPPHLINLMILINQFDLLKYLPENSMEKEKREQCLSSLKKLMEEELDCSADPLKTIKEIIEENISYYSSAVSIYCYWNGPGQISNTPPGIAIAINDNRTKIRQMTEPFPLNFRELTIQNLEYLYSTPTGKILLDQLLDFSQNNQPDENIFIMPLPSTRGNNIAYQDPNHALHLLAYELMNKQRPGPQFIAALKKASETLNLEDPYQWLADSINHMPELNLIGFPGKKPFLPEKKMQFQAKDIEHWIDEELELPPEIKNHFLKAIIVSLHDYATPNVGTGSIIRWNPSPESKKNQQRPIAIGLAHELCHAYYNALGMQPGRQDSDESTVLFEYLTTGLGPWKSVEVCENRFREEWNDILSNIPNEDKLNKKTVKERIFYDLDASDTGEKYSCTLI